MLYLAGNKLFKVARYSFLKKMEIYDLDPYFWKIITCLKIKSTFLCKTTSKEFEFLSQKLHNCRCYGNNDVSKWRIFWL